MEGDATADETWPVRGKLQGKNGKKAENVSGIACATAQGFPRTCLVVDDNMQEAQFVTVKDGEVAVGNMIPLIDNVQLVKSVQALRRLGPNSRVKGFDHSQGSPCAGEMIRASAANLPSACRRLISANIRRYSDRLFMLTPEFMMD